MKKTQNLAASQRLADGDGTLSINSVNLKNALGQVQADCGNCRGGWLALLVDAFDSNHNLALRCREREPSTSTASGTKMKLGLLISVGVLLGCSPETSVDRQSEVKASVREPPLVFPYVPRHVNEEDLVGLGPRLRLYTNLVAICDFKIPGLIEQTKRELRSAMGPTIWTADHETGLDSYRENPGNYVAHKFSAPLCGYAVQRQKRELIYYINAAMAQLKHTVP